MKEKLKNAGKTAFHVGCIIVGMAIMGFGFSELLPKKQYSRSEVKAKKEKN